MSLSYCIRCDFPLPVNNLITDHALLSRRSSAEGEGGAGDSGGPGGTGGRGTC